MGCLLVCDAPNCIKSTPAVVRQHKPAAPEGWWLQVTHDQRLIVGCCDSHFVQAADRYKAADG